MQPLTTLVKDAVVGGALAVATVNSTGPQAIALAFGTAAYGIATVAGYMDISKKLARPSRPSRPASSGGSPSAPKVA